MTAPSPARWSDLSFRTVVRLCLLLMLGLMGALAYFAWQSWARYDAALLSRDANRMADAFIASAAQRALERGLTATALSAPAAVAAPMRSRIDGYRSAGDQAWASAIEIAGRIGMRDGNPASYRALLDQARQAHDTLVEYRRRADAALVGPAPRDLQVQDWIGAATAEIRGGARLRQVAFAQAAIAPQVAYANQVAKHLLWQASEFAGIERANVAAMINSGVPAVHAKLQQLAGFRRVVDDSLTEVVAQKAGADAGSELATALTTMEQLFGKEFGLLRSTVMREAEAPLDADSGRPHYSVKATEWFDAATRGIDSILAVAAAVSAREEREADTLAASALTRLWTALAAMAVLMVTAVAAGVLMMRKLGHLELLRASMAELAGGRGDLGKRLAVDGHDEVAQTAAAFNRFVELIQGIVREVQGGVAQIGSAAQQLGDSASGLRGRTEQQCSAAASAAAAVEQLTVSLSHVAEFSRETAELSRAEDQQAEEGDRVVGRFAEEMKAIAEAFSASTAAVNALGERSERIGSIVKVIREIAEQTNLLALNAAIEAARAGEQGRGFAVVADEVRKLAERTAEATREIGTMVGSIQEGTRDVVSGMGSNLERIDEGVSIAGRAAQSLGKIRNGAQQVMDKISDIASATRQQQAASQELARSAEDMARSAEENSAVVEHTSEMAGRLGSISGDLDRLVAKFRV